MHTQSYEEFNRLHEIHLITILVSVVNDQYIDLIIIG